MKTRFNFMEAQTVNPAEADKDLENSLKYLSQNF